MGLSRVSVRSDRSLSAIIVVMDTKFQICNYIADLQTSNRHLNPDSKTAVFAWQLLFILREVLRTLCKNRRTFEGPSLLKANFIVYRDS